MNSLNKTLVTAVAILIMGCSGAMKDKAEAPGFNDMTLNSEAEKSAGGAKQMEVNVPPPPPPAPPGEEDGRVDAVSTPMTKKLIKNGKLDFRLTAWRPPNKRLKRL
ncbi:MAG: hypothetical protein IPJ32_14630 [Sphingobacteriaceae bacterium]|nr:hypothetical protein [Sphingobacteriaceae bacterium]